jgi:hypothetical protein
VSRVPERAHCAKNSIRSCIVGTPLTFGQEALELRN